METGSVPLYYGGVCLMYCDRIPSHVCDLLSGLYVNCKVLQVHWSLYTYFGRIAADQLFRCGY